MSFVSPPGMNGLPRDQFDRPLITRPRVAVVQAGNAAALEVAINAKLDVLKAADVPSFILGVDSLVVNGTGSNTTWTCLVKWVEFLLPSP